VITYNIARCYEQLGDSPKALRNYRNYLRAVADAADKDAVNQAIAYLETRLATKGVQQVLVYAEPSNATISIDGKVLGNSPASLELVPGNHQVNVSAAGFEPVQRSVVLTAQRSMELSISLRSLATGVADAPRATPAFEPNAFAPPPAPRSSSSRTNGPAAGPLPGWPAVPPSSPPEWARVCSSAR